MKLPEVSPSINYEKNKGIPFLDIERIQSGELTGKNAEYKRALLELPQDREGLNIERVNGFLTEHGLTPQDGIVIYPERANEFVKQAKKIQRKLKMEKNYGWDSLYNLYGAKTFYEPNLRLFFVSRHKNLEEFNGSVSIENSIIHETVHANSKFRDFIKNDKNLNSKGKVARSGLGIHNKEQHSSFWEEGVCDYFAGKYHKIYTSPETKAGIRAIVNLGESRQKNLPVSNEDEEEFYQRNGFIIEKENSISLSASYLNENIAMLSLIKKGVLNEEDLLATRFNADGIRNFIKKLEQLKPGLYYKVAVEKNREKAMRLVIQTLSEKNK